MRKANLGCGTDIIPAWDNVDIGFNDNHRANPSWTIKADILEYLKSLPDSWLEEVKAHHILEHVDDLDAVMYELARVCQPHARIDIVVPLANTLWAIADPTHRRFFNHRTFEYYCVNYDTSYVRKRPFKMVSIILEREPNEWFQGIEWVVANLHVILEKV